VVLFVGVIAGATAGKERTMKVNSSRFAILDRIRPGRRWLALATTALGMIVLGNIAGASLPAFEAASKTQPQPPAKITTSCEVWGFGPASFYPVDATWPESVAVGDFNGDGHPDLVTANFLSNSISELLYDPSAGFGSIAQFDVGQEPGFVTVGDFNGDNAPDLAVANEDDSTVSVLLNLNDGSGGFNLAVNYAVGSQKNDDDEGDF
jgi:hypothetical protein